jgi:hypothetical protein
VQSIRLRILRFLTNFVSFCEKFFLVKNPFSYCLCVSVPPCTPLRIITLQTTLHIHELLSIGRVWYSNYCNNVEHIPRNQLFQLLAASIIVDYKSRRICSNCLENFDLAKFKRRYVASNPIACGGFDHVCVVAMTL